jgi:hypothetical protein
MGIEQTEKHPIDAVILWVDGNDAKHRQKMLPYLKDKHISDSKNFRTRYDQVNEIKYSVDSLLKFAPYIRTIHIVTDNQTPDFLKEKDAQNKYQKVIIVDHTDIFKGLEEFLPTFNSLTIESCIHRIPHLAEHFIYLNDDIFLINNTVSEDFFKGGLPVLRGKWLKFDKNKWWKKNKENKFRHKTVQQNVAKFLGFNKYFNFKHTPHPIRKSTLEQFFSHNNEVFLDNIKYKFRNKNQFITQGLANHIEIKNGSCILSNSLRLTYFRSYKKPLIWYKIKLNKTTKNKLFLGLQSLDLCPPNILKYILNWLKLKTS